ncbi:MAG: type II secretion system ATPase GspE [Gammaproteobacteria bacterium]|nr:type II secretion system ATPase GspE [Gammaproteobacteria bacterium]
MSLPFNFARRHGVLLTTLPQGHGLLAREDAPLNALLEAQRVAGATLPLHIVSAEQFELQLQQSYESSAAGSEDIMTGLGDGLDLDALADSLREPMDLMEAADDTPIIRFINAVLAEAIRDNASDIHIEPFERRLLVRMRIDGILHEIMTPPPAIAPLLVSRIKIMAKLDIAEKRLPQDGRISLRIANRPVDVRVSTMPAGHGERIVLRLLDKRAGRLELDQIGMDPDTLAALDQIIHLPHGIFLVTGPTGSGKTTTLYAALGRLNDATRNIMTVEDPIEYYIDGIAQSQVNLRTDMTFARGLRAMLRQDPDVVMVGEVRDLETAEIAIQASLTGHMVFSTLHTNTAIGAITRLRDMGTEPFLLSSSLAGVLAQRLIRLLCPQCKTATTLPEAEARALGVPELSGHAVYDANANGCAHCNGIGYKGRTAIYELIHVDDTLRGLIHDGAAEAVMAGHVRQTSPSLTAVGVRKIVDGLTSPAELLRVTRVL